MPLDHSKRYGRFTSSEIHKLLSVGSREMTEQELKAHKAANPTSKKKMIADGFGAAALTYIKRKNQERALGRSHSTDVQARPMLWGHLLEGRCFEVLPTAYSLNSSDTLAHPRYPELWAGTPDGFKYGGEYKTVVSIKCPWTLESFCDLVEGLQKGLSGMEAMNHIRANHDDGEKFYWQIVSDACIAGCEWGELLIYCPYDYELQDIKLMAENTADNSYYFISMALDGELPFLPDGGEYRNLNSIVFQIPQEDKDKLTAAVVKAGSMLSPRVASHEEGVMIL